MTAPDLGSGTDTNTSLSEMSASCDDGTPDPDMPFRLMLIRFINDSFKGSKYTVHVQYTQKEIQLVLDRTKEIFKKQEMLVQVRAPVTICGDIHGQFYDLKRLLRQYGKPPNATYIFLGDYIDRGKYSLEVIMLLLVYKARYPNHVILLRGNHECGNINRVYGFYEEMCRRNMAHLYPEFNDTFNWMPVSALVNHKILCMHGGISQHMHSLSDITALPRPMTMDPTTASLLALDILWADPDKTGCGFSKSKRGVSQQFGMDVLDQFCVRHKLDLVVRAHQVVEDGFERLSNARGTTRLVTLFSAPNYCGEMDNSAGVMMVSEKLCIRFKVMKPGKDKDQRDAIRHNIPSFDVFPDLNFQPLADGFSMALGATTSATSSAAKSIENSRLVQGAKKKFGSLRKKLSKREKLKQTNAQQETQPPAPPPAPPGSQSSNRESPRSTRGTPKSKGGSERSKKK